MNEESNLRQELGLPTEPNFVDRPPPREPDIDEVRAYHARELPSQQADEVGDLIMMFEEWRELSRQVLEERAEAYGEERPRLRATSATRSRVLFSMLTTAALLLIAFGLFSGDFWTWGRSEIIAQLRDAGGIVTLDEEGKLTGPIASEWEDQVKRALRESRVNMPQALAELSTSARSGSGEVNAILISPVGEAVESDKPTFTWHRLEDADHYLVAVYKDIEDAAQEKNALAETKTEETEWTIEQSLEKGKVYLWLFTAVDARGQQSGLEFPDYPKFKVLNDADRERVQHARASGSRLVSAIACIQAGLFAEAEQELQALVDANPHSDIPQEMLTRLRNRNGDNQ